MPINNYLVVGMTPTSNEMGVALTVTLSISFQRNMNPSTLNSSTLKLRKVNGGNVPVTITYDNVTKKVAVKPTEPLEPSVQYQMEIVGGQNGVVSVIDDYLSVSRFYEFYTKEQDVALPVKNIQLTEHNGIITAEWSAVDLIGSYQYLLKLSHSNLPENAGIWPSYNLYETNALTVDIPKKVEPGTYYVHIQVKKNDMVSEYRTASIAVKEAEATPSPSEGSPDVPVDVSTDLYLRVLETYPRNEAFHITPDRVGVLFSEEIDLTTYADWFRVEEVTGLETASFLSLGINTVPGKIVEIEAELERTKVLTFIPDVPFQKDKTYQLILKKETKTPVSEEQTMELEGNLIVISGKAKELESEFRSTFQSAFTHYYVTVDEVKTELRYFGAFVDEKTLAKLIVANSKAAYQMASLLKNFDATLYVDGAAPFYMHEYVKYKTSYDVALTSMVELTMGTDKTIRLADLQVQETGRQSFVLQSLITELKAKIKPWEDLMHGRTARGYASMGTAVYSEEGNPYPDFFDGRTEFPELGS